MLSTVDFAELTDLEEDERWDQIGELLAEAGRGVERAGADFLLLCTTTFHRVADQVAAAVEIPLLHLADVVAEACLAQGATTVGLRRHQGRDVGRASSPTGSAEHGVTVIMPATEHHDWLNSAIYDELVHGRVVDATRRRVVALTEELWDAGAGAILLGCTEIELLISQADVELPVIPCTTLHVNAALDRALA